MLNLFNISDSKALIPIALLAAVGIGGYWLWTKSQANKAATDASNAQASAASVPNTGQLANLALLSSLFGGTSGGNTAPPAGQPTYTAPAPAPAGNGSSTGNTPVTQGI